MLAAFAHDTEAVHGQVYIHLLSVTSVGLDLGKNILQVHPDDARDVLVG